MKKAYEYFTELNNDQIYIDDRGGRVGRYAVYEDQTCVEDCLNKKKALSLANWLLEEKNKTNA